MVGARLPNLTAFIIVGLLGGNALAQEPGKLVPLPDRLPPSVEARVGSVEYSKGLPTPKGIGQLFRPIRTGPSISRHFLRGLFGGHVVPLEA
jgi:hypothetical protein